MTLNEQIQQNRSINDCPPLISVVMPVYNTEAYVGEAIESVLNQTFTDFELIIVDDGSTDRSLEIINSFAKKDSRIRIFVNESNLGVSKAITRGFKLARGKYIARMDADDICLPHRFEKQIGFMQENPGVGLLGTWGKVIDVDGNFVANWKMPTQTEFIKWVLLWESPLIHPSVLASRNYLLEGLPFQFNHGQDYELWDRMAQFVNIENLPEIHLIRRSQPNSIGQTQPQSQRTTKMKISQRAVNRLIAPQKMPLSVFEFMEHPTNESEKLAEAIGLIYKAEQIYTKKIRDTKIIAKIRVDAAGRQIRLYEKSGAKLSRKSFWQIFKLRPRYIKRLLKTIIGRLF